MHPDLGGLPPPVLKGRKKLVLCSRAVFQPATKPLFNIIFGFPFSSAYVTFLGGGGNNDPLQLRYWSSALFYSWTTLSL